MLFEYVCFRPSECIVGNVFDLSYVCECGIQEIHLKHTRKQSAGWDLVSVALPSRAQGLDIIVLCCSKPSVKYLQYISLLSDVAEIPL